MDTIPDFSAIVHLELLSWIPILSSLLPSDIIRIWKRGQQLRFDFSLLGFEQFRWKRGDMSFLILESNKENSSQQLLTLNHDDRTVSSWCSENVEGVSKEEVEETVHLMMVNKMMTTFFSLDHIKVFRTFIHYKQPIRSRSLLVLL